MLRAQDGDIKAAKKKMPPATLGFNLPGGKRLSRP
jgi:hypothetical protein